MSSEINRLKVNPNPQMVIATVPITTLPFNVMTELNPYT